MNLSRLAESFGCDSPMQLITQVVEDDRGRLCIEVRRTMDDQLLTVVPLETITVRPIRKHHEQAEMVAA